MCKLCAGPLLRKTIFCVSADSFSSPYASTCRGLHAELLQSAEQTALLLSRSVASVCPGRKSAVPSMTPRYTDRFCHGLMGLYDKSYVIKPTHHNITVTLFFVCDNLIISSFPVFSTSHETDMYFLDSYEVCREMFFSNCQFIATASITLRSHFPSFVAFDLLRVTKQHRNGVCMCFKVFVPFLLCFCFKSVSLVKRDVFLWVGWGGPPLCPLSYGRLLARGKPAGPHTPSQPCSISCHPHRSVGTGFRAPQALLCVCYASGGGPRSPWAALKVSSLPRCLCCWRRYSPSQSQACPLPESEQNPGPVGSGVRRDNRRHGPLRPRRAPPGRAGTYSGQIQKLLYLPVLPALFLFQAPKLRPHQIHLALLHA